MPMLDRYRKSGGFMQLLMLLETCGPTKQERFLEMIASEEPAWADTIRSKMLSIQRIYSWDNETLNDILCTLQDLTVAVVLLTATDAMKDRIYATLSQSRRRKIDDLVQAANPSQQEIITTNMKVIETVRKMATEGVLKFERIAPDLVIESEIEEKLMRRSREDVTMTNFALPMVESSADTSTPAHAAAASPPPALRSVATANETSESAHGGGKSSEVANLKKRVSELTREVASLRHDLSVAKGKLDQIKKIA